MPLTIPPPRATGHTTTTAVPLYWAAWGPPGAPQLLVLHGGPGAHHDYLLPQMLELASDHELIFYDQRGGGRSRVDGREVIGWRDQVDDLRAIVPELIRPPVSIIGYSWGGLLALLHLVNAPSDAPGPTRLVLIDPAPITRQLRTRFEEEFARRQSGPTIRELRSELAASGLRESNPEEYRQRAFELSVAGYFADPGAATDLTPFRVLGRVQQSIWESLGDFDIAKEIAAAKRPLASLVVHGREDPIPLESSELIARQLGARLVVIEGSGHVPYVEKPQALFSALRGFLEDTAHLVKG